MEMVDVIKKLQEIAQQEVAPPGREKQVKALKGKVDNPYAVAWASYNNSKGKKEAIGDELADESGFKDIDTAKQEKSRLYALLKDKKEKYNATMAGQLDYDEQKLQDEIEELENELGIGEATQPELPGMTPQNNTLNINGMTTDEDVISMIQDTIDAGKGDDAKDYLEQFKQYLFAKAGGQPDQAESEDLDAPVVTKTVLNTEAMKKEDKKPLKEAITMTADSPEEAGMLMQIMKLAGVKQVTPDMLGAEEPTADVVPSNDADAEANPEHGEEGHDHGDCPVCGDDAVGSNEMGNMRDMISQNDTDDEAEEGFVNSPDGHTDTPKVHDVEKALQSGGLGASRKQVRKEYPGDNPLAVKEDPTEEELSNSLRTQYEGFKNSYQEATKVAETKGKDQDKDGDVDSKDYMKSKDIAIKKAMAKK
jgi:hypothetical protein